MPHVVFVAPRFLENTNRYVAAFAALHDRGVRLSVVSADPAEAIPVSLKKHIVGHYRVADAMASRDLLEGVRALQKGIGPIDRLTGALEQLQVPMAEVREALGIEGIHTEVARNFRDKDRMKDVLRAAGVPVAKSGLAVHANGLRSFAESVGYPIVVKPQAGLGARATYRIGSRDELEALLTSVAPSERRPLQVEEFVRAREHTCETVTIRGETVWRSGTRYLPSPLEVLENPWIQYCVLLPRETEGTVWNAFAATNDAALRALFGASARTAAGTALTHMEWFLRDGVGPNQPNMLVNEVGVRPPGVAIMPLMGLAHDTDLFADWAELIALDRFTPKARRWAAGAAFLRGHGHGSHVASVTGVAEVVAKLGDALVELRAPKVGQPRALEGYEGEGWATVRASTTDGAKQALKTLIEGIRITYR